MPKPTRRVFFTADARLSITRATRPVAAAKFAAATGDAPAVESIATLVGYPIVWNAVSSDRGGYKVRLMPNSATFAAPTQALFHHNPAVILGNTANATLRLTPDSIGVKAEIDLPDTTDGHNTETLVRDGYVSGMSFAMVDSPDGNMSQENGESILNATAYVVDEVTITGIPAFTQTSIKIDDEDELDEEDEDEDEPETEDYAQANAVEELRFEKLKFDLLQI